MSSPPWMLLRLAIETAQHHAAADDDRLALMDVTSVESYRSMLAAIYGFELRVEQALARVVELETSLLRERLKVGRLREDLLALGLPAAQLPRLPYAQSFVFTSTPQALGWMFVVERQSLLSGLIHRELVRTLGDDIGNATRYLCAYGDRPAAKYRELGELLGAVAQRYSAGAIISAAHDAFRAQRQWYLTALATGPAPRRRAVSMPV